MECYVLGLTRYLVDEAVTCHVGHHAINNSSNLRRISLLLAKLPMQLVFLLLSTFTCLAAPVISEIRDGQPLPCSQPLVRREWRALSIKERARWLRAVKVSHLITSEDLNSTHIFHQCLASTPQRPRLPLWRFQSAYKYPRRLFASAYDDFSWIHVDMFEYIHDGNLFLPWR